MFPSKVDCWKVEVCIALSGVRNTAPPSAPDAFFANVAPQTVSAPSEPPSIEIAPPFPPLPTSPPSEWQVLVSTPFAPDPLAVFCENTALAIVRSLFKQPTAPPFDAVFPSKRVPTIVTPSEPVA